MKPRTFGEGGAAYSPKVREKFVDGLSEAQETLAEIEKAMMKDEG
ncbi:MAG: hypothetical protein Q8L64_00510 [bacterium]|nr:hypothetical protein [bacterium]